VDYTSVKNINSVLAL